MVSRRWFLEYRGIRLTSVVGLLLRNFSSFSLKDLELFSRVLSLEDCLDTSKANFLAFVTLPSDFSRRGADGGERLVLGTNPLSCTLS